MCPEYNIPYVRDWPKWSFFPEYLWLIQIRPRYILEHTFYICFTDNWEELTHWKRRCWEGLGAGGEGDHRGRDSWMASPTQLTWVWVNSRSWWWTGRPGVLRFMGSQRVGHWATGLNWTEEEAAWILINAVLKYFWTADAKLESPACFCGGHGCFYC